MKRAAKKLVNHIEIEFLKGCTYEEINSMMCQLHDKIKILEQKLKKEEIEQ